jgi:hypothetical protein
MMKWNLTVIRAKTGTRSHKGLTLQRSTARVTTVVYVKKEAKTELQTN